MRAAIGAGVKGLAVVAPGKFLDSFAVPLSWATSLYKDEQDVVAKWRVSGRFCLPPVLPPFLVTISTNCCTSAPLDLIGHLPLLANTLSSFPIFMSEVAVKYLAKASSNTTSCFTKQHSCLFLLSKLFRPPNRSLARIEKVINHQIMLCVSRIRLTV